MTSELCLVLVATCALASPAPAASLLLDTETTTVEFRLGATLHTVKGSIELSTGTLQFNAETGHASGRIVLDATTATTGNDSRDKKMHEQVLESDRFPAIVFQPRLLEGVFARQGESTLRLHGVLDLHGSSHNIVIEARIRISGDELTGEAGFTVPYVAWGMKDPSVFLLRVKKEVDVSLVLAGSLENRSLE